MPPGVEPLAMFQEAEATTVVLTRQQAEAAGLDGAFPSAWITLDVASDLEAVGFLAVITAAMAAEDIGINVVSAYHHDHLFVREDKADRRHVDSSPRSRLFVSRTSPLSLGLPSSTAQRAVSFQRARG